MREILPFKKKKRDINQWIDSLTGDNEHTRTIQMRGNLHVKWCLLCKLGRNPVCWHHLMYSVIFVLHGDNRQQMKYVCNKTDVAPY